MTLEKLASITAREFSAVRKEMVTKDDLKNALIPYATKEDLKQFATKDDLKQFATKDDLQKSTVEILSAFDKILVRFDTTEKDSAADKLLHDRHERKLEIHEKRFIALETTTR